MNNNKLDSILFYINFIIVYILSYFFAFLDKITCNNNALNLMFDTLISSFKFTLPEFKTQVINKQYANLDKTIYVSHHYSYSDSITLILALKQLNFVAKNIHLTSNFMLQDFLNIKNLFYESSGIKHFNNYNNKLNIIVIDKKNDKISGFEKIKKEIIERKLPNIWIYPSGTFPDTKFRTGAFALAKELGFKICPVQLYGFNDYSIDKNYINKKHAIIEFLQPFTVDNIEDAREYCQTILVK
jgi:1-acyl-sn-glycerol-3-phosphate acyltransferase